MTTLQQLESELTAAGVEFTRRYEGGPMYGHWEVEVGGEVVARGGALGEVAIELRRWWAQHGGPNGILRTQS